MAAAKNMIRIRLKAYDHQLIDKAAETIVEAAKRTDATSTRTAVSSSSAAPTSASSTSSPPPRRRSRP